MCQCSTFRNITERPYFEICCRWQKTRLYRNFQLDSQRLHYEYESLRSVLGISLYNDDDCHKIANIDYLISSTNPERSQVTYSFAGSFIERFHKVLCLQSIAIMSRRLGMATKTTDGNLARVGMLPFEYWSTEQHPTISGHQVYPSIRDNVDQLEVQDLIY